MKIKILLFVMFIFSSCVPKNQKSLNPINVNEVNKISVSNLLQSNKIKLSINNSNLLIENINKSKFIGKYKWIDRYEIEILLKSNTTLILYCNKSNLFKVKGKGDDAYKISEDIEYFKLLTKDNGID